MVEVRQVAAVDRRAAYETRRIVVKFHDGAETGVVRFHYGDNFDGDLDGVMVETLSKALQSLQAVFERHSHGSALQKLKLASQRFPLGHIAIPGGRINQQLANRASRKSQVGVLPAPGIIWRDFDMRDESEPGEHMRRKGSFKSL
ncbi:hypothetical protein ASJ36_21925 (plasmid) [Aeromonas sp. ARM81]|nr:hypothetical protein ASJ36_21925 [Aeromonas sp. ARM81]